MGSQLVSLKVSQLFKWFWWYLWLITKEIYVNKETFIWWRSRFRSYWRHWRRWWCSWVTRGAYWGWRFRRGRIQFRITEAESGSPLLRVACRCDFFLLHTRHQCLAANTGELMEPTSAFARSVYIWVLSFIILDRSVLIRCRISIRSIMQILHWAVREDFMHWIRSPCHRIVGVMISFILALTWFELVQFLHRLAKCLANASALAYPPLPVQLGPNFLTPDSMTFHTSVICCWVRFLR